MNKKDKLILLVQTEAIVRDIRFGRSQAAACVEFVIDYIAEEDIPNTDDMSELVEEYLDWQHEEILEVYDNSVPSHIRAPKPEWIQIRGKDNA